MRILSIVPAVLLAGAFAAPAVVAADASAERAELIEALADRWEGHVEQTFRLDGETWRNTSGAWLTITASPETYPPGWAQETGLPDDIPEWTEQGSPTYTAGDLVSDRGAVYRCLTTHTAWVGTGWRPSTTPSLWTAQG